MLLMTIDNLKKRISVFETIYKSIYPFQMKVVVTNTNVLSSS